MLWLLLVLFLFLLFLGVPIVASMGIPAVIYFLINDISFSIIAETIFRSLNSFTMVAVPLFILMGYFINSFRETDRVYNFARVLLKNAKGYSAKVNLFMSVMISGMSGAALADIAGLGRVQINAMEKEGFTRGYGSALTVATSLIGPIFPPSVPLIIYALVADVSSIDALIAGVVPAIILTIFLYLYIVITNKYKLKDAPIMEEVPLEKGELWRSFKEAFPMLIAAPIIILSMLFGVFSPGEAGAVASFYLILLSLFHKEFTWERLIDSLKGTFISASTILLIVTSGSILTTALTLERLPEIISSLLLDVTTNKTILILIIILILLIIGLFMDAIPALIMLTPIFLPIATQVGIDPIHLGIVMVFTLMLGTATPPVGMGLYVAADVGKVSPVIVMKELLPLYVPLLVALIIVALIPNLTLWLVNLL